LRRVNRHTQLLSVPDEEVEHALGTQGLCNCDNPVTGRPGPSACCIPITEVGDRDDGPSSLRHRGVEVVRPTNVSPLEKELTVFTHQPKGFQPIARIRTVGIGDDGVQSR
jgi:hypothetical protein